ncbi:MAG: hypothetical protein JSV86_05375 [Gemmatimonadota bacterium]|nr:MAG: hypothetical protein JSV86_05375 [Gemmatimonadota bacterium]
MAGAPIHIPCVICGEPVDTANAVRLSALGKPLPLFAHKDKCLAEVRQRTATAAGFAVASLGQAAAKRWPQLQAFAPFARTAMAMLTPKKD